MSRPSTADSSRLDSVISTRDRTRDRDGERERERNSRGGATSYDSGVFSRLLSRPSSASTIGSGSARNVGERERRPDSAYGSGSASGRNSSSGLRGDIGQATRAPPFTPRRSALGKSGRVTALSAKRVAKYTETIRSVRTARYKTSALQRAADAGAAAGTDMNLRSAARSEDEDDEDEDEDDEEEDALPELAAGLGDRAFKFKTGQGAPDGSFYGEASFVRAPLNRRVPPASPHRKHRLGRTSEETLGQKGATAAAAPTSEGRISLDTLVSSEHTTRPSSTATSPLPGRPDLLGLDVELQEALLIEDLLFVLMGIEGQYIEFDSSYDPTDEQWRLRGARFVMDPSIDSSLRDLVDRIIPLATYFTSIDAFVEMESDMEYGTVNHALCAAIRDVLKEYQVLLAQLEHQFNTSPSFTLQKFWFYVHPTLHTLSLVHGLTSELTKDMIEDLDASEGEDSSNSDSFSDDEKDYEADAFERVLKEMEGGQEDLPGVVKGGEVLTAIWERMMKMSGDPAALQLYQSLLLRASQPYAHMLVRWIDSGILHDTYGEFMVAESKHITRGSLERDYSDDYWDRRYTLRDGSQEKQKATFKGKKKDDASALKGGARIPPFLEFWKGKILLAGKYLNVLRECGMDEVAEAAGEVRVDEEPTGRRSGAAKRKGKAEELVAMNDEGFYRRIEEAYTKANRALLKLLVDRQELLPRLRSLKRYFFLDQGDFFTTFADASARELQKDVSKVSIVKLQSLLELTLRNPGSATVRDPFKDDVKVGLASENLYKWLLRVNAVKGALLDSPDPDEDAGRRAEAQSNAVKKMLAEERPMTGFEALVFDFSVKFPLSLVISRKYLLRYQLLLRYLIHLKCGEMQLAEVWTEHNSSVWRTNSHHAELEMWKARIFALRAKMLFWMQQVLGYSAYEVIEPNWRTLESRLVKVRTVDQLMAHHDDFLNTCLKECMLTQSKLLMAHSKLLATAMTFARYVGRLTKRAELLTELIQSSRAKDLRGDEQGAEADLEKAQKHLREGWDFFERFESNWKKNSDMHRDVITYFSQSENSACIPLVVRLYGTDPSSR